MYFPSDMTFQYFFFNTYPGYFLQALPIALIAGAIAWKRRSKRARRPAARRKALLASLFVCYITGLLCLTLFERAVGEVYYRLFYHAPSGRDLFRVAFEYYLVPDFFHHFGAESIGNILMFLPFGILYPLFREHTTWNRTVAAGVGVSLGIELLQPLFGRSFDINDIILNGIGVVLSATAFHILKAVLRRTDG